MQVKGLDKLVQRLRKLDARVQQEVKEEIFYIGQKISTEATTAAPKSIIVSSYVVNNGYSASIKANAGKIAAYLEFGTGPYAAAHVPTLPKEWQQLAHLFKTTTPGTSPAQPYFYPAYRRNVPILVKNLKVMLKREAKR